MSETENIEDLAELLSKDMETFSWSVKLTRLVDGDAEYTYADEFETRVFESSDDAYEHLRAKKRKLRADGLAKFIAAARARGIAEGMERAAKVHDAEIARLDVLIAENTAYCEKIGESPYGGANKHCRDKIDWHRRYASEIRSAAAKIGDSNA